MYAINKVLSLESKDVTENKWELRDKLFLFKYDRLTTMLCDVFS